MTKRKAPSGRKLREFPSPIAWNQSKSEQIASETLRKMCWIAGRYGIPITLDEDMWKGLFIRLLIDFEPPRRVELIPLEAQIGALSVLHGIPATFDAEMYFRFAVELALDHGIVRIVFPGRPKETSRQSKQLRLFFAVNSVRYETPSKPLAIENACKLLNKRHGEWNEGNCSVDRFKKAAALMCDILNESAKKEAVQTA